MSPEVNRAQRRVLIVSPHFPPVNAPDHQRVRMSLPYLEEFGWRPFLLTVDPEKVEGAKDSFMREVLPAELSLKSTNAFSPALTRRVGLGDLGIRAYPHLKRAGEQILKTEQIDLIYFSTTVFNVFALARGWQKQFGIPYVLDFQDPWLSDYYDQPNGKTPPGGWTRYRASQFLAKRLEPFSLRKASHVTSVSSGYVDVLRGRYPWLRGDQFTVLPFGASEHDFELLQRMKVQQAVFKPEAGKRHWVYLGRGGADMSFAVRAFLHALQVARERSPESFTDLTVHFIGTDYATSDRARKTVEPLAVELGVADLVHEQTTRIPYFEALQCLLDADAILVFGSDDSSYTASKIYPCILANKPLLAIFYEQSSVVEVLRKTRCGSVVTFNANSTIDEVSDQISQNFLSDQGSVPTEVDWNEFEKYTAREMTRRLCTVFDNCIDGKAVSTN
ncbi:MAG TPA: glycosyltransferase [Pyrinomonadaceae bacterium]